MASSYFQEIYFQGMLRQIHGVVAIDRILDESLIQAQTDPLDAPNVAEPLCLFALHAALYLAPRPVQQS